MQKTVKPSKNAGHRSRIRYVRILYVALCLGLAATIGGIAGVIGASSGNDLYHPIQAMLIGGGGAFLAYKMHFWVENKFKIDDAVGAVAVHGYAGFYGVVVAGFMLWGYPSSPFEGYAPISPWGNFLGALIMFFVLGFFPALIVSKILHSMGKLRIPREIEMVGLDINHETLRAMEAEDVARAIRQEAG